MRKGTFNNMEFSGKYEIFKYSWSPGFQKYAIENLFEKSWFTTELWLFLSLDVANDKTLFPTNVYTTHDWHDTIDAARLDR